MDAPDNRALRETLEILSKEPADINAVELRVLQLLLKSRLYVPVVSSTDLRVVAVRAESGIACLPVFTVAPATRLTADPSTMYAVLPCSIICQKSLETGIGNLWLDMPKGWRMERDVMKALAEGQLPKRTEGSHYGSLATQINGERFYVKGKRKVLIRVDALRKPLASETIALLRRTLMIFPEIKACYAFMMGGLQGVDQDLTIGLRLREGCPTDRKTKIIEDALAELAKVPLDLPHFTAGPINDDLWPVAQDCGQMIFSR